MGTPSDFGVMGERPANKELLDYLTATFVENGWSIKKMHRLIMLSNTYQQSSKFDAAAAKVDPREQAGVALQPASAGRRSDSRFDAAGQRPAESRRWAVPACSRRCRQGVVTRGGWKKDEDPSEARAPQRLHLCAAQYAVSDVRSLRYAGYARELRAAQHHHYRPAGPGIAE